MRQKSCLPATISIRREKMNVRQCCNRFERVSTIGNARAALNKACSSIAVVTNYATLSTDFAGEKALDPRCLSRYLTPRHFASLLSFLQNTKVHPLIGWPISATWFRMCRLCKYQSLHACDRFIQRALVIAIVIQLPWCSSKRCRHIESDKQSAFTCTRTYAVEGGWNLGIEEWQSWTKWLFPSSRLVRES